MKPGWTLKRLGEVCDFEGGSQPPKSQFSYQEKADYIRFLQIRDFASDKNITYIPKSAKNRLCKEDDILIGRYGASVGKILTGMAGAYNVALVKTIPNLNVLDLSWFHNWLRAEEFQYPLLNVAARSAQNGFSKEDIYGFLVPVPPLPEQRRIVEILDKAFDAIAIAKANTEKNLQNARVLFDRYQEQAFTKDESWSDKPLLELCSLFVDSAHRTPAYQPEGIAALRPRDVVNGVANLADAARVSEEEYKIQSARHRPSPGDIVYSRELSYGWAAVLPKSPRVCLSQGMCLFRPAPCISTEFLLYVLNGPIGRTQATRAAVGAAHPHINLSDIKTYRIPHPSLDRQTRIVAHLDSLKAEITRLEDTHRQKLTALGTLKKSLLEHAFTGVL